MNDSISLGRLFGIPIRLHWTFLGMVLILAFRVPVSFLGAVFLSVLLHELGHGLIARRFGIHVREITFWFLGGMTNMTRVPEDPRTEGWIAVGGPAANLLLAALAGPAMVVAGLSGYPRLADALGGFTMINLLLGSLNLIPAFPMDGGRILRAWLARSTDWVSATERAVSIGRFFILVMIVVGIVLPIYFGLSFGTMCVLPITAIFLWYTGMRELLGVRMRHGRSPFGNLGVKLGVEFPGGSAEWATNPGGGPGPGGFEQIDDPEGPSAQRPAAPEADVSLDASRESRGFTESYIERLERSRGRLRPPPDSGDEG